MDSLASHPSESGVLSLSVPLQPLDALTPGDQVIVNGGRLDGLRGDLVAIRDGKCIVRLFANVQLVIPQDRLTTSLS